MTTKAGHLVIGIRHALKAFKDYGGYSQHYRQLVAACDSAMKDLMEAFQDPRMG